MDHRLGNTGVDDIVKLLLLLKLTLILKILATGRYSYKPKCNFHLLLNVVDFKHFCTSILFVA